MPRISLGDKVRDPITKFEGIAICRAEWLYGCVRIAVQKEELDKDNKPVELTFDETGLVIVAAGLHRPTLANDPRPPGGPDRHEASMARRDITR